MYCIKTFITSCSVFLLLCISMSAWSHPEDDFCNDGGLDPLLCAELAALDSETATNNPAQINIDIARSPIQTLLLYIKLGMEHILPLGLDHLLFVLALLLSTYHLPRLLLYISIFTLAHSITLILSYANIITIGGPWIEVLIALSIVFVAVENIFLKNISAMWRVVIIFLFGLLHGMGFAGALRDLNVPDEYFFTGLLGFNLGVEIAQVGFALVVFTALAYWMKKSWYRQRIVIPLNVAISLIGSWWVYTRI